MKCEALFSMKKKKKKKNEFQNVMFCSGVALKEL